jgi:branched-chain amino acid transport system substrate-binding protein
MAGETHRPREDLVMTTRQRFTVSLVGAFGALGAQASAQSQSPYKIGVTFPLTGPLASSALLYIKGAEVAVEEINNGGGLNGHPLQLIVEDSQGAPQAGIAAMRKLVQVDGVQAILTIFTNVVSAQIPLAEQVKVPFLCTVETDVLRNKSPYAFQHAAIIQNKGKLFGAYWKANKVKKIYGLVINNSAGPFFSSIAKPAAESAGAEYKEASFNDGESDYRGLVARVKEYGPDNVFLAELGGLAGAQIIRQLRESGVKAPVIMPGIFYTEPAWRNAVGSYIETVIQSGITYDPKAGHNFVTAYQAKTGLYPSYQAGEQYEIIKMFALAIGRSSYSGPAIRDALAQLKNVPSIFGGTYSMDSTNYSIPEGESLWQVRSGKLVRVSV